MRKQNVQQLVEILMSKIWTKEFTAFKLEIKFNEVATYNSPCH